MDVRINALVVSDDGGDLASYYAKKVILGSDAFVMDIKNYADYSAALRKKLKRELASEALDTPLKAGVKVAQPRKASRISRSKDFNSNSGG